jgi:hypothetical protein
MPDWYSEIIPDTEPHADELRGLVRTLRNAGFNTTACCGHEMWIECEWYEDGEATRLFETVAQSTRRPFGLRFTWDLDDSGWSYRHVRIELGDA